MTRPLLARRMLEESGTVNTESETDERVRRVFTKEPSQDGGLLIRANLARWNWAFLEARDSLDFNDIATSSITVAPNFYVKRTCFLGVKHEDIECVTENTEISQRFTLAKQPPPHTNFNRFPRSPSIEEFDAMLSYIGEYLGVSEYKNDLQYGTFTVKADNKQ